MKIIALEKERENKSKEDFQAFLENEAAAVWQLCQKNIIREIYFRSDRKNAVLILECDSLKEAEIILADLPLVKNNLIEFDLVGLKPYDGFKRLFKAK